MKLRFLICGVLFIALIGCSKGTEDPTEAVTAFADGFGSGHCEQGWAAIHPDRHRFKQDLLSICGKPTNDLDIKATKHLGTLPVWTDSLGVEYKSVAEVEIEWEMADTPQLVHVIKTRSGWRLLWGPELALE